MMVCERIGIVKVDPERNPGNAGLQYVAKDIDKIWSPFCNLISRADFWVLGAKVRVLYASMVL